MSCRLKQATENAVRDQPLCDLTNGEGQERLAGCSKWTSSAAAASEEVRRTFRYVEPLSNARAKLADLFSSLIRLLNNIHTAGLACYTDRHTATNLGHAEFSSTA